MTGINWRKLLISFAIALGIVLFVRFILSSYGEAIMLGPVSVGETLTVEPNSNFWLTPLGSEEKCSVNSGSTIKVLAERDDYVLVQCISVGREIWAPGCPVGTKVVMSKKDFRIYKAIQSDRREENKEENKRRAAEKLFQSEK